MARFGALVITATLMLAATSAFALGKGTGLYGVQLSTGTGDFYSGSGPYITAFDHSEIGAAFQYWRLMSDDYALAFSAGAGFFRETDEANDGSPDIEYSQSSWNVRLGGDRVVAVGDRALVYVGPGLEFWSGKAELTAGAPIFENESVNRISLSGRIGGTMLIGEGFGINCEVGARMGRASAEEGGAKATWWPSAVEGAVGVVVAVGGN